MKLHKGGVIFKANKTGKVDQAAVTDIESTQWMRVARGFELNVALTNGSQFKFEGFKEGVSPTFCCHHTGLKVNDQLVAYATRFLAVRLKKYVWSHHRALKAKV